MRRVYSLQVRQVFRVLFNSFSILFRGLSAGRCPCRQSPLSAVPVRFDLATERLWCGDQARVLRPKTFALLQYLIEHPGQLLTQAALYA
jgi:DNA-binding response OmpR family regulator